MRVWVAGCSTGEEAYSIAMLVFEFMAETSRMNHVQIFATDLDEQSLNTARDGVYPKSIEGHVSSERLASVFCSGREKLQDQKKHPGDDRLRPAQHDQGPSLLQARPDQLPQSLHLPVPGPAGQDSAALPLRPKPGRVPFPWPVRVRGGIFEPVPARGQESENLSTPGRPKKDRRDAPSSRWREPLS